ncbi:anthranilate synthase component I family protein [Flavobacterium sp. J372]|uniref:anthranilate synthase component I family protein n=1 Tax=Flavobacterium sp. J372 TaxID=2898436 RepID=UPI00215139ED|nr:anthranilate synthase component I family protein [Flavobacterium sp. J372]MCR5862745.1 anthranilate synthase component I family protein [Flavobacterium sp. J372]
MRTVKIHTVNPEVLKPKLFAWAQQFREVVFLDSNDYPQQFSSYDAVLAVDAFTSIKTDYYNAFDKLNEYQQVTKDWVFGYLSYDLKNDTEALTSLNFDGLGFSDLYFFQPRKLFLLKGNQLETQYLRMCDDELEADFQAITNYELQITNEASGYPIEIQQRVLKESYIKKVGQMLAHIQRGDIYEANFCMEFYAEDAVIEPCSIYQKLNEISTPPFACFFKNHKQILMSASPERYLRKEGSKLISQPIKGTARRSAYAVEDAEIKQQLTENEKERSENIMIVDLVRNDLSRTAQPGSVQVEELCGAYTFRQVHHLISTVTSELRDEFTPVQALKTTFPMGSMTGAPKISAMQIIEKLEETKRGLYSGAVGYFTPQGDFDFNVVIRSILYNAESKYVSFSVGSAITAKATPEQEYEECLVKATAMRRVLEGN